MRILIIPDVHGRNFWEEPCKHIDEFDKVVFLGDYHDPYPFQVSEKKSLLNLRDKLVPFVEQHRDKVICLFGNHDANYLAYPSSSRYDDEHHEEIASCLQRMNLQMVFVTDNYVFSHSGIVKRWLEKNCDVSGGFMAAIEKLNTLDFDEPLFMEVSPYRGGMDEVGSCIWGDVDEFRECEKIPDIYQIFGHTQMDDAYIAENFACLDCRKAFVLDTETKELREYGT